MKKRILGLCLVTVLLVTGCTNSPKLEDGKEIVAEIDGFKVTAEELYDAMKKETGINILMDEIDGFIAKKEITDDAGANSYADAQINSYKASYQQSGQSFAQALLDAGFKTEAEFKAVLALNYKKNKVFENYIKGTFTDAEIEKYYDESITGEQTVRHILIIPDVTDTMTDEQKKAEEDKALATAKDIIKRLDSGADFASLAKEKSEDTGTAANGGLFANFTAEGTDKDFFKAAKALKANEYTKEPVKSQFGYHVILKVSEKDKKALKDVRDYVIESLLNDKIDKANEDTTGAALQN
jgi:foldase protein PrsA